MFGIGLSMCYSRNVVLCLCIFKILAFINSNCRCSQIIALYYRLGRKKGLNVKTPADIVESISIYTPKSIFFRCATDF
jgi:hypothetical protein